MIIKFMMQFVEREFYSGMISERLKIKRRGNVLTFGPFFFFEENSETKIKFYLHQKIILAYNDAKYTRFTCDQMAELLDVLEIREDLKNTIYHSGIKIENVITYKEFTVPDEWVEKYIIPKIIPKKGFVYYLR